MKNIYLSLLFLCAMLNLYGIEFDFHEDMEAHNCSEINFNSGIYKSSSNSYWWIYTDCRNAAGNNQISGKSILLNQSTGKVESSQLNGGYYKFFNCDKKDLGSTMPRSFKVEVIPDNGNPAISRKFCINGQNQNVIEFTIDDIDVDGLFKLRVTNLTPIAAIVIDDIKWKSSKLVHETWNSTLLSSFENNPETSCLYDFSYAGYENGESEIPDVKVIANVLDYGAIANDGIDDTKAIQKAIDYTASQGGGAVLIPKGRFILNGGTEANQYLLLANHVVLRGSGNGQDGTILFQENYIEEEFGQGVIFSKKDDIYKYQNITITENSPKGSHYLKVSSTSLLLAGDELRIQMLNPKIDGERQDDLSREMTAPLEPAPEWTNYKKFAPFECHFEVEEVLDLTTVKLKQPLMCEISPKWQARITPCMFLEKVGVENLRLESNFQGDYGHHKNWEVDYGWCGIEMGNVKDGWIKDVVIQDMTCDIRLPGSMNITVENVVILGLDGHHGIKCPNTSFSLIKDCYIQAERTHAVGGSGMSHGNVFSNIGINSENGMIDHHGGGFMSHNLYEKINNSHADSGGAEQNMPHGGQENVFWNIISNVSQGARKPGLDFFSGLWNYPDYISQNGLNYECYKLYPKSVLVGVYHPDYLIEVDHNTGDRQDEWISIEGINQEGVNPASLYNYQLTDRLDKMNANQVSNLLMGFNLIYPHEKNSIWQDGKIAGYLKDVNVAFLRWPGGTVCSFYHWDSLSGEGWKDSWDPVNQVIPKAESEFMDIDEYISLVKETGATPLVGINMSSGRRWDREQDGLNEAIALMQYCKDKNFKVEYWYLDNEPYQEDSNGGSKTPEIYADLINTYVPVMKAFDPSIKIVANWKAGFDNKRLDYEKLLSLAGANIDVVDAHWYWAWSDATWEKWLEKTPMVQWTGVSYADDIIYFHQMVKDLGFPNIKLATFEWNTGPIKVGGSLTASRTAFIQAEMMMQFISGGLDYAVFWPIQWPNEANRPRSLVNTSTNEANPNFQLFKFLGKMQGGTLMDNQFVKTGEDMVSIAVQDNDQKILRICILNKSDNDLLTDIQLDQFPGMKLKEAQMYTVNLDGSNYSLTNVDMLESGKAEITKFLSKSISITLLTFEGI